MKDKLLFLLLAVAFAACNLLDVSPQATTHLTPNAPGGPDTSTGAGIYAAKCAVCHGDSAKGLATLGVGIQQDTAKVTQYVHNGGVAMLAFPEISDSQIVRLKQFLMTFPLPTDGGGMFMRYCATCHQTDGSGTKLAPGTMGDTAIWSAVHNGMGYSNRSGTYIMAPIPQLSASEIALIGKWLGALQLPRSGDSLYTTFCVYCHTNPKGLETSTLSSFSRTLGRAQEGMPAFTWLNAEAVDSIYVFMKR